MRIHDASLMVSYAKACINNPQIKVVSFDIFDTLLERPCLQPKDIFYLINERIKDIPELSDVDFCKIRIDAEEKVGTHTNPSFDDIWDWIRDTYHLSSIQIEKLKEAELEAEQTFLKQRKLVAEIYHYACKKKRKIIAVSDMYLPTLFLQNVLQRNGYTKIQSVYVSCEQKKTKREGDLFKNVYTSENIKPHNMLHMMNRVPIEGSIWSYEEAFPIEMRIREYCLAIIRRIKRTRRK